MYDKNKLMEMYNVATEEPYSFMYVALTAKKKEDMFSSDLIKDNDK